MIEIFVSGRQLSIPESTTITMEQSNNLLGDGEIGSDIVWTFDVPAEANAVVLDNAHYIYARGTKRYDSEVRHCGTPIAKGSLYVQSAKGDTVSCGMTINEISKGWGGRYLKDNNYGEDTVISTNREEHAAKWVEFLQRTLDADSNVKFMLFCASGFLPENEDFGSHVHAINDPRTGTTILSSRLSGLENEDVSSESNSPQFRSYVNRLFSNESGTVINNTDYYSQGVRIMNKEITSGKQNGYAFCPAIRAIYVLEKIFAQDGFKQTGSFLNDARARNIFIQSLRTMDGDVFQFGEDDLLRLDVNRQFSMENDHNVSPNAIQFYGLQDEVFKYIKVYSTRNVINSVALNFRYKMELENNLNMSQTPYAPFTVKQQAYVLVATVGNATIPREVWRSHNDSATCGSIKDAHSLCGVPSSASLNIRKITSMADGDVNVYFSTGSTTTWRKTRLHNSDLGFSYMQMTNTEGFNGGTWLWPRGLTGTINGGINVPGDRNTEVVFRLCICSVSTFAGTSEGYYPGTSDSTSWVSSQYGNISMLSEFTEVGGYVMRNTNRPFNTFANTFSLKEHLPYMTNGELLKTLMNMFGLNVYVNSQTKEVELSYFKDIDEAQSLDITPYVLNKNAERNAMDMKRYEVIFSTCREQNDSENAIEPVVNRDGLPEAKYFPNKSVYVENENAFRKSTKIENSEAEEDQPGSQTAYYSWKLQHGNNKKLKVGSEDDELQEVKVDVNIPNMRVVDTAMTTPKYLQEIAKTGISPMFDNEFNGEFDLVVTQYRGRRLLPIVRVDIPERDYPKHTEAYIEEANPTCYDEEGNVMDGYWTLAASGEHSVGEECLSRLYELKANNIPVRIEAIVPADVFRQIYSLNMPQNRPMKKQTRWVLYRNQRYLPVKISYEFGKGDNVGVVIDAIRRR